MKKSGVEPESLTILKVRYLRTGPTTIQAAPFTFI